MPPALATPASSNNRLYFADIRVALTEVCLFVVQPNVIPITFVRLHTSDKKHVCLSSWERFSDWGISPEKSYSFAQFSPGGKTVPDPGVFKVRKHAI